jgi:hypothetical protein
VLQPGDRVAGEHVPGLEQETALLEGDGLALTGERAGDDRLVGFRVVAHVEPKAPRRPPIPGDRLEALVEVVLAHDAASGGAQLGQEQVEEPGGHREPAGQIRGEAGGVGIRVVRGTTAVADVAPGIGRPEQQAEHTPVRGRRRVDGGRGHPPGLGGCPGAVGLHRAPQQLHVQASIQARSRGVDGVEERVLRPLRGEGRTLTAGVLCVSNRVERTHPLGRARRRGRTSPARPSRLADVGKAATRLVPRETDVEERLLRGQPWLGEIVEARNPVDAPVDRVPVDVDGPASGHAQSLRIAGANHRPQVLAQGAAGEGRTRALDPEERVVPAQADLVAATLASDVGEDRVATRLRDGHGAANVVVVTPGARTAFEGVSELAGQGHGRLPDGRTWASDAEVIVPAFAPVVSSRRFGAAGAAFAPVVSSRRGRRRLRASVARRILSGAHEPFDLAAYLGRVEWTGTPGPDADTLRSPHLAHATTPAVREPRYPRGSWPWTAPS